MQFSSRKNRRSILLWWDYVYICVWIITKTCVLRKMCDKIYFTSDQLASIQEAFNHFDINGDGLISIDEFKKLLESLGKLLFFFTTLYVRKEIYDKGLIWPQNIFQNISYIFFFFILSTYNVFYLQSISWHYL